MGVMAPKKVRAPKPTPEHVRDITVVAAPGRLRDELAQLPWDELVSRGHHSPELMVMTVPYGELKGLAAGQVWFREGDGRRKGETLLYRQS